MTGIHRKTLPIRVGISTCLLGERVRFDGGHKHDRFITDILGEYFEFIPVCPELEVGMGIPRESVRLVGDPTNPRMIGIKSDYDWTERMNIYSSQRVRQLESYNLSGYILKSDSPSCGKERVRVYNEKGMPIKKGRGLYADVFIRHFPLVPVEEEGRLNDAALRENFIVRVFSYHRLQQLRAHTFSRAKLIEFHTKHKFLLLAHSPKHYTELGRLVAHAKRYKPENLMTKYENLFMEGLNVKTSYKKNVNVLNHILGYLRNYLSPEEKKDILDTISDYHKRLVPIIVPITLLSHYIRKHNIEYIKNQIYLSPHPKELMLRNHV
jgi:uncharacterized protein YbgA (DUF1722 family)/uncharacterized protein YbbK (DUF523 family)